MNDLGIETISMNDRRYVKAVLVAEHFELAPNLVSFAAKSWQSNSPASVRDCVQLVDGDRYVDLTAFDALIGDHPQHFDEQGILEMRQALGAFEARPALPLRSEVISWQDRALWKAGEGGCGSCLSGWLIRAFGVVP